MLDVSYLQNSDFFDNFHLVAGENGLHRTVSNVVILDFEGIAEQYIGFGQGDFVITNLMFAKNHPERIYRSFSSLIQIGVSAFAIKTVIFTELPPEVLSLCNAHNIPVFLFQDIFIEDVILNITDHLRASTDLHYFENLILQFLQKTDASSAILEFLTALNVPHRQGAVSSMYLQYRNKIDDFTLWRTINALQMQLEQLHRKHNIYIMRYKNGLLFLEIYPPFAPIPDDLQRRYQDLLLQLRLSKDRYYIGINDSALPLDKLDIAILRCLYACQYGNHISQVKQSSLPGIYHELGLSNLLYVLSDNAYTTEYLKELLPKIDPDFHTLSDLQQDPIFCTIHCYVENQFDIERTAKVLFQHPNTIRYRLKKLKDQLEISNETMFRLVLMLLSHI